MILLFSFSYFVILFGKLSENIYILISKYPLIGKIPFINMLNDNISRGIFIIIEIVLLYLLQIYWKKAIHEWKNDKKLESIGYWILEGIFLFVFILLVLVIED